LQPGVHLKPVHKVINSEAFKRLRRKDGTTIQMLGSHHESKSIHAKAEADSFALRRAIAALQTQDTGDARALPLPQFETRFFRVP
jgi:hypothetical protein